MLFFNHHIDQHIQISLLQSTDSDYRNAQQILHFLQVDALALLLSKSTMLTAQIIGSPVSINCNVKYRFRSKFVPSITLTITSGRPSIKYLLETTSSGLYGDKE